MRNVQEKEDEKIDSEQEIEHPDREGSAPIEEGAKIILELRHDMNNLF